MKLTYALDQSIALQKGDSYFDLHSDYELVSALHDGARCYLHFTKRPATWVKVADPSHLALVFEQVQYFQQSEGLRLPTSLEEISFKVPGDLDMDWFMEQPEGETAHILFRLEDDQFIRIGAAVSFLLAS
ncbi:MAG: hypothetical protein EOO60_11705 [Hymenobacter sp.]|nr:MAG: hypothetical protein EOO60_11705 [Hymenobacter sp.]